MVFVFQSDDQEALKKLVAASDKIQKVWEDLLH